MAKKKAKAVKPTSKGQKKGGSNRLLILLTLIALVPFSLPTLVVLFVGLLPTLVAAIVERGKERYAWICVGGLNFAGLSPWLFKLWFGHHTLIYSIELVTGITMMLAAYACAGLGWLLYMSTPPVVMAFMKMTGQRRSTNLTANQKKLVETWGDGVMKKPESEDELLNLL